MLYMLYEVKLLQSQVSISSNNLGLLQILLIQNFTTVQRSRKRIALVADAGIKRENNFPLLLSFASQIGERDYAMQLRMDCWIYYTNCWPVQDYPSGKWKINGSD